MKPHHNLLVISDLHLSEGLDPTTGKTSRLEDFLRDDAFHRFLQHHEEIKHQPLFGGRPWLLILNGDVFDFLQVVSLPPEGRLLQLIKGVEERSKLSADHRHYGLGTTALESAWKLKQIARGHPRFFAALGWFVSQGNEIAVVRGNHDAELHWKPVQDRFVMEARRAHVRRWRRQGGDPPAALETYRRRIHFYPWMYHEPGRIYVEHGCQYEAINHFPNPLNPVLVDSPDHLALPWGSLFVRYVFNRVETLHPFADNVKPLTRYLSWALRKNPVLALGVLLRQGWVFLRAWARGPTATPPTLRPRDGGKPREAQESVPLPAQVTDRIQELARQHVASPAQQWIGALLESLISFLTFLLTATLVGLAAVTLLRNSNGWWMPVVYALGALATTYLRRALAQILARVPRRSDLLDAAVDLEQILAPDHAVSIIAMGHDHEPAIERLGEAWYVNTGTWVPVYQMEGPIEGREALTFLRVARDCEGPPELLRWDDAAGAAKPTVLWDDPSSSSC